MSAAGRSLQLSRVRFGLACAAVLSVLGGCASHGRTVASTLDPRTGVTLTYAGTALLLYRETPGRSAHARSYVHLGPVEVNRSGDYRYFIWLSAWATGQSADLSDYRERFASVVLYADGEPLPLDAAGWAPAAIGASEATYDKPLAAAFEAYYPVTRDQIRLISTAEKLSLRTQGAAPAEYAPWRAGGAGARALADFLETTRGH